jgi:hypothetical protein
MIDRADPHARERAIAVAREDPLPGVSPQAAAVAIDEVLESIGDTCPECPPEAGLGSFAAPTPATPSSCGMRTGDGEQSAAALPFRTQAVIGDRARTGDRYRGTGTCQKECYHAEYSRPSPDEFHEHSSRMRCAERIPRRCGSL